VEPVKEPHKWQREREAFLAGKTVEFRNCNGGQRWYKVDLVLETTSRAHKECGPLWDRDWLEFRIVDDVKITNGYLSQNNYINNAQHGANLRLTWRGPKLVNAEVIRS
jgi:hypothetical protein